MPEQTKSFVVDTSRSPHAKLRPVPVSAVTFADTFWQPRRALNHALTIPSQHQHCEETHRIDNFRRAAGTVRGPFVGQFSFNDSDVYKWLEAAGWDLADSTAHSRHDSADVKRIDDTIAAVASAQQPDGYLNTYFMFDKAKDRWTNLKDLHELYCAGHLIQGAIAHYRATANDSLLTVAKKFADCICDLFGPAEAGKRPGTCGHEEIEMALVELFRATGERKYLDQANYFIDARGHRLVGGDAYRQDHKPFRDLDETTGHAVRAVYLACGAADVYTETGDPALLAALEKQWANMTTRRMYVTGGIGSRYDGEAFGKDYELPNARAYTETCAAIGSIMWAWRMLQIAGDARYADLIEWQLYNGVLPGWSLDGKEYFYQNPLADDGSHRREKWFGCACCPPNVARLMSSLPAYVYSVSDGTAWVHLYAAGSADLTLPDGRSLSLVQHTRYPWDSEVKIEVRTEGEFTLQLRIPGWCAGAVRAAVGRESVPSVSSRGQYLKIHRQWNVGDTVDLWLPMAVRRIIASPRLGENTNRVAVTRGPLVYCLESADHPGLDLRDTILTDTADLTAKFHPDLLGGLVTLHGKGQQDQTASAAPLYHPLSSRPTPTPDLRPTDLTLIPYYAWANRGAGAMQLWVRRS